MPQDECQVPHENYRCDITVSKKTGLFTTREPSFEIRNNQGSQTRERRDAFFLQTIGKTEIAVLVIYI